VTDIYLHGPRETKRGFTTPDHSKPFFTEGYLESLVLAVAPYCDHEYELRPGIASSEPRPGVYVCRKCGETLGYLDASQYRAPATSDLETLQPDDPKLPRYGTGWLE
jgi:hypothetical protein